MPGRLNILHLSATKSWGGGGNHIENLCYELSHSNPEVTNIIVVAADGQFHERLKEGNFLFYTLPLSFKMDPRAIVKFLFLTKKEKIDIVHIHGSTSLSLAVIAAHLRKLPPFILSKKTSFPIQQRKRTLYKYNHSNIRKILCVSDITKEISSENISDKNKLTTIYHGTRIDNKSTETPFRLREKLNIDSNSYIIGNIANHIWPKNLETFIEVANTIVNHQRKRNFHFVQMGIFSRETDRLRSLVEQYDLGENFSFLGFIPDASNFIPQFDVSVITSESEGIPQVIYESFYHEVPVISTDVGGISEAIEHEVNGLLTKVFDFKGISRQILRLIGDDQLKKKFTDRSKKKLFEKFTSTEMARQTLSEYKKIINGRNQN